MDTDINIGIELIQEAYKKELEDKLWQRYLVDYALYFNGDNFKSFEEYKELVLKPAKAAVKSKPKTKDEILKQSEQIVASWKKQNRKEVRPNGTI